MTFEVKDRRAVPDTSAPMPQGEASPAETFIMALRAGASVDEAEKVGEMLLRFRASEEARTAERAYNAAFAAAMAEMPPIPKDAIANRGSAGRFSYSKLETILGKAQPVLGNHGLHLGFNEVPPEKEKSVAVVAICRHSGGHSVVSHRAESPVISFSNANTPLQNREGTLTALKRSLAMTVLGLAVGGEEEAAPYITEPDQDEAKIAPYKEKVANCDSLDALRAVYKLCQRDLRGADFGVLVDVINKRKSELSGGGNGGN